MTTTRPDVRAVLTDALADWSALPPYACLVPVQREAVAAALAPVVDRLIAEGQARALRDAADAIHVRRFNASADPESRWPHWTERVFPDDFYRGSVHAERLLRDRADALHTEDTP